jgi:arylsulfatase
MAKKRLSALLVTLLGVYPGKTMFSLGRGPKPKPNVIIILMDDMGYGDPECYNGQGYHTPNINRLAAEGMRFTNFYAAQAICTASRAALLTGCYPNRLGIRGAFMPWDKTALNPKETTIAAMLKKAGYHTGMVGKWHLGAQAPFLPLHYGFDEYLGLPYSNDMWAVDYNGRPITDTNDWRHRYPPLPLLEGDTVVRYIRNMTDQGELTGIYTRRACRFIRENKGHPFFLYLAHSMVHVPIAASPAFLGKSKRGLFGDVMMEVDWSVGEIMRTLRENGLEKNTIVIFTSDNGPWLSFGDHAGNTGGLREGKATSWEGGQREPCIMRWPGKIPAGTVCSQMAATLDILPTLARFCGATLPAAKIDGVDISGLLTDQPDANPRDELAYYYHSNNLEGIRKGQWKLVFAHRSQTYLGHAPGHDGYPGKTSEAEVPQALYDLATDPGETHDVQVEHPDVVNRLEAIAARYRADLGDDLTNTPCRGCRPAGQIK